MTKNQRNQYVTQISTRPAMDAAKSRLIDRAIRCLEETYFVERTPITSPDQVRDYLRLMLSGVQYEVFSVILLDNRHRVIKYEELFKGTVDGSSVHPREVVRLALDNNAVAVIFSHNHPSGLADPSQSDIRITQRLRDILALIDVRVLDHIIVGSDNSVSMAEKGLI